jgi:vancomycin resistance protein YoaR
MLVYPGQEAAGEAKRKNSRILAGALNGSAVQPGETWSLWKLAGAPTRAKGYGEAAAIVNGELTSAVGGATCLVSTVVYNAGLLAGLEVVERAHHSIDTYGESRYFELGRDATIEYGYLDLRFRNDFPWPLQLELQVDDDEVRASFRAPVPRPFEVDVTVEVDRPTPDLIEARTRRAIRGPMLPTRTWLSDSRYRLDPNRDGTPAVPVGSTVLQPR